MALLEECGILGVLEQEGKGKARKCKRTSRLATTTYFFAEIGCMYGFHARFGMHGTCMWFLCYDLSLA